MRRERKEVEEYEGDEKGGRKEKGKKEMEEEEKEVEKEEEEEEFKVHSWYCSGKGPPFSYIAQQTLWGFCCCFVSF